MGCVISDRDALIYAIIGGAIGRKLEPDVLDRARAVRVVRLAEELFEADEQAVVVEVDGTGDRVVGPINARPRVERRSTITSMYVATTGNVGSRGMMRGGVLQPRIATTSSAMRTWRAAHSSCQAAISAMDRRHVPV